MTVMTRCAGAALAFTVTACAAGVAQDGVGSHVDDGDDGQKRVVVLRMEQGQLDPLYVADLVQAMAHLDGAQAELDRARTEIDVAMAQLEEELTDAQGARRLALASGLEALAEARDEISNDLDDLVDDLDLLADELAEMPEDLAALSEGLDALAALDGVNFSDLGLDIDLEGLSRSGVMVVRATGISQSGEQSGTILVEDGRVVVNGQEIDTNSHGVVVTKDSGVIVLRAGDAPAGQEQD